MGVVRRGSIGVAHQVEDIVPVDGMVGEFDSGDGGQRGQQVDGCHFFSFQILSRSLGPLSHPFWRAMSFEYGSPR